ncbi:hypothetical protein EBB07_28120 [Paenibacillaceae bacterium]|nr:hypothetical protein EBB07_28120 [Paenibacillaceae bacterium]
MITKTIHFEDKGSIRISIPMNYLIKSNLKKGDRIRIGNHLDNFTIQNTGSNIGILIDSRGLISLPMRFVDKHRLQKCSEIEIWMEKNNIMFKFLKNKSVEKAV